MSVCSDLTELKLKTLDTNCSNEPEGDKLCPLELLNLVLVNWTFLF